MYIQMRLRVEKVVVVVVVKIIIIIITMLICRRSSHSGPLTSSGELYTLKNKGGDEGDHVQGPPS